MRMKKQVLILICFLIVISGIGIVNAESASGTLGTPGLNSSTWNAPYVGGGGGQLEHIRSGAIQYSEGTTAYILFPSHVFSVDAGAPSGATTPFNVTYGGVELGNGTMGYQRVFDQSGTEIPGNIWLQFNNYFTNGLSGAKILDLNYNHSALYSLTGDGLQAGGDGPNGLFSFTAFTGMYSGVHLQNRNTGISVDYSLEKYSDIGRINGTAIKTTGASQVYIVDGTTNLPILSDPTVSTNPLLIDVLAQSIKVAVWDGLTWYNSSVLFGVPITPTPTVTPTPAPTIAPGYVRTTVKTIDGTTGNEIHGSNIFLYDVEGSTWSNSTSDGDGSHYIDTLPYHTINAYATFTAFADHYSDAEALGLPTGYDGGITYSLSMFPPALSPGEGNVNLYVTVQDADTYDIIRDASVQVRLPTGAVQGGNTGSSGTEIFVVPNSTVINIAATKAGYVGSNTVINSGAGTTASATVYLHKAVVTTTPTSTIPAGGVTPVITVDSRTASEKDQAMMDKVRDAGPTLIDLAVAATIIGLLGLMAKAF
jgi:hypothetical protein